MLSKRFLTILATLIALLAMGSPAQAEQKRTLGKWDVHYIVINTTFLTPEVAKAYGIVRSSNRSLVNVSVLDRMTKEAQSVEVSGTARNLLGNTIELKFAEVKDGDAIYYLAPFSFDDEEHYRFNLKLVAGKNQQSLKFEQKLYRD